MELIILLSVLTIIVAIIGVITWIDILTHPEQTA